MPTYFYPRRRISPTGRTVFSVHENDGRETDRFEAYPEEADVTFTEAGAVPILAADLLRLPLG